ncbi:MAG: hypothetical protein KGI71_05075 [Patescibacteria group bacterium]|nr:hypothetical protein [Patescibacteria group bacterium]
MTQGQAALLLAQHRATFVKTQNGVEWWRMPDGAWMGKRVLPNGDVEVRHFPQGCNCGG